MQLVTLANYLDPVKDVKGMVFLCEFGWRMYAHISKDDKDRICEGLCKQGKMIYPHSSEYALIKGKSTTGLYMMVRTLLRAKVNKVALVAYGMKMLYTHCLFLTEFTVVTTDCYGCDLGRNIECDVMLLFNVIP